MEKLIANWLGYGDGDCDDDGSGYGDGNGNGYGDGNGNGYVDGGGYGDGNSNGYGDSSGSGNGAGFGAGYGNGNGYGDGNGNCNGYGNNLLSYKGEKVYYIDGIPTLIERLNIERDIASGYVIEALTLKPCYVAKVHGYFAHGVTAHSAYTDAVAKWVSDEPLEYRIAEFIKRYPSLDARVDNETLFSWHNILTGSCEMGRKSFAELHEIDIKNGTMTVDEFIELTIDAYGGDAIKQLKQQYNLKS